MKIGLFKVHAIWHEDFEIHDYNSGKNVWDIKITIGVDKAAQPKEHIITVCFDLLRLKLTKQARIKVYTQYWVTSETSTFNPLNDTDFYFYADLIKSACDHARVIIDTVFKGTVMQGEYLKIDPIQKYYLDVKNGHVKFLN